MTKWHNGPNGPGICKAKKGNCPFGNEESHFSSKEEAIEAFNNIQEDEHGLLPGIEKKVLAKSKPKFTAVNSRGYSESISKHVSLYVGNKVERSRYIKKILEQDKPASEIAKDLNRRIDIEPGWNVTEESDEKLVFSKEDSHGGVDNLVVDKNHTPKKKRERGYALSYNSKEMPTSLSNYVYSQRMGSKEEAEYMRSVLSNGVGNSKELVDTLNNDELIVNDWTLEDESEHTIVIKGTDTLGNNNYIEISK